MEIYINDSLYEDCMKASNYRDSHIDSYIQFVLDRENRKILSVFDTIKIDETLEQWKDLNLSYVGKYQISNYGRIRNNKNKIVRQTNSINGYKIRRFRVKKNVEKAFFIHRLVAEAFIPNPENKPQVNHINRLKYDNRVENLEWVTRSENAIHLCNNEKHKDILKRVKYYRSKKVRVEEIENPNNFKDFNSAADVARYYNVSTGNISSICNNKNGVSSFLRKKYKAYYIE